MNRLKKIFLIINLKSVIVTILAVVATYFCRVYSITADFPLTLVATAIVFPIVFSIGGAYKRREVALNEYGSMKAHGRALYLAARDWLDNPNEEILSRARSQLGGLLDACRNLFTGSAESMRGNEEKVYRAFSDLSRFVREDLRDQGLPSGEVSRCNQYLSKIFISFETIKHIFQYRTPRTLRAFSDFFISILPPLYGPYFAYISVNYSAGLEYVTPVLFSFILVSLSNIQEHLENPFDQIGEDDVTINVELFVERLY